MGRTRPTPPRRHPPRELKLEIFEQVRSEIWRLRHYRELERLVQVICLGLGSLGLRFDFFGINLIDDSTVPPTATGYSRRPSGEWRVWNHHDLTGSPLLAIWQRQQLVYRPDLLAEDPYHEAAKLGDRRAVIDAPFPRGTLAVSSVIPHAFSDADIELLQEMAALCAEGFGRLDDLRALERRAQEAEVLSAAIAVVAGASGLEEVFQVVVREAARLVAAERATLFLYDEHEKVLVPRAQLGHQWESYRQIRLQPGEDVSGEVLLTGTGLLYDDHSVPHRRLRPENQALLEQSTTTAGGTGAVAPLKLGDRVLGTLSVRSRTHHCTQRDLVLLERLAAQAALAIERGRHDRELALNLALQRLRNTVLQMSCEEDWDRVRISFRDELAGLVQYNRCSIQFVDLVRGEFCSYGSKQILNAKGAVVPGRYPLNASLRRVAEENEVLYRRNRDQIDASGDPILPDIHSVVDVPFSGGTVAMNSLSPEAFGGQDIEILRKFALVVGEAAQRLRLIQRQEAVRQVREAVWRMEKVEDLLQVLTVIREQLLAVGVVFDDVGLNVVDTTIEPWAVQYYYYYPDQEDRPGWVLWSSTAEPTNPKVFEFWRAGQILYRPRMTREDMLAEGWEPDKLSHPVVSVVDVPFSAGTLALNSRYAEAFPAGDLVFLQELAGVLSEGFGRLEDLKNLAQRAREAEALAEGISAMAKSEKLDQVLQRVVEGAARLTGSLRARIFLCDEGEQVLLPRAQVGHRWEEYRQLRITSGEGVAGRILATGQAQLINQGPIPAFGSHNQEIYRRSLLEPAQEELERVMGVPLVCGGQVAGVLSVNGSRRPFTDHDLELLAQLGEQAALAIERTQRERALSLNLALQRVRSEILQMQEQADWLEVVEVTTRELAGLVEFHRYAIQLVRAGGSYVSYGMGRPPANRPMHPVLREVVEAGRPCYRRSRREIEARGEDLPAEVQSVVDVPFLGGTIAMSSIHEDGFSDQDIQVLERFAEVTSEAYQRLRALQRQEAVRQVREAVWHMSRPADLEQVLTVIRDQLQASRFTFSTLGVAVVEEQGDYLRVRHHNYVNTPEDQRWVSWIDEPADGQHPVRRFWRAGKTVYRRDLQAEDPFAEAAYFLPRSRCVLDVPFSHGTLAVGSPLPNAFSPDDIELVEELAAALSEGFRRLDDLRQLEQRAQEAEALASVIDAVYSYTSLGQRLQEIARQIQSLIGAQRCMVQLYDERAGVLVPQAREGYGEEVMQLRIVPGEGLSGHVYNTGRTYFNRSLPDPQLQPLSPRNQELLLQAIRGSSLGPSIGVPLKLGGQVIGAVVAGQVGRVLEERDLLLLERLAAQASLAIERSRQEGELALNLALQRVRNEVLRMESEEDWKNILRAVEAELSLLVVFNRCGIQLVEGQAQTYNPHPGSHPATPLAVPRSVQLAMAQGKAVYRRTRAEIKDMGDEEEVPPEVGSVVDVPFTAGTIALNSTSENAFSEPDIRILERFALVLDEAHRRLQDLRELEQARQRLQQSQKLEAVGQLTAGIAHNFNNLLQANLGNINLAMLAGPPEVQSYLQDADAAAMRGADLVRQLMLFARSEVKKAAFAVVDLGMVVADTVSLCRKTIDRHIELQVELPAGLPLVQGDAGQLEQVLLNLYLNARDALEAASPPAPWIRTVARAVFQAGPGQEEKQHYVCVEVSDNGTGMDAKTRERIFEPFFTTKEVGKGTGLGLATAYGILQRHQGWIECQSELGTGTTFLLFLPATAEPAALPVVMQADGRDQLPGGCETLMVVDDEDLVRRSATRLFSELGYRVLTAADGLRCLELFAAQRGGIDLVVLDLSMPGISGREVLRQLKAQQPDLKVIVFTGHAADPGEFSGRALIVNKPFSLRQLAEVVRHTLDT